MKCSNSAGSVNPLVVPKTKRAIFGCTFRSIRTWATSHNDVAQVLMLRKVQPKIARLVFGTTNGLTEPALLEHFIGHPGARAIWGNVPMMHAKVFLFESKR